DGFHGLDQFTVQAMDIMTSPKVREAFDLSREPSKVVERYGSGKILHQTVKTIEYGWSGKPFLLARRLVEAGGAGGHAQGRVVGPPQRAGGRHLPGAEANGTAAGPGAVRTDRRPARPRAVRRRAGGVPGRVRPHAEDHAAGPRPRALGGRRVR